MPRTELRQVHHRSNRVVELDFEVNDVFEVSSVAAAVLLEDERTRISSVKNSEALTRSSPVLNVLTIKVKDVALVLGRWSMVGDVGVLLYKVEHRLDERRLANTVWTGNDDEHRCELL